MNIQAAIAALIEGESLSSQAMTDVMRQVMGGEASDVQIAGFLVALRIKGETVDELRGAVSVMRELMKPVTLADLDSAIDIVGTGGDGAGLFNVSTASCFVAAAGGASVAKHGNRSVSSKSGAADLLEAAGVNLALDAAQVAECVERAGVGFMFAVNHHPAMKYAVGPRRELGVRTIFNLLGPMTNPAGVRRQVLGVYDRQWLGPMAEVLRDLGSEHVLLVHSDDGLDEISIAAPTTVVELKGGEITESRVTAEDLGLQSHPLDALKVSGAQESLALIESLLAGEPCAAADMVALNAGAALYVAGRAESLKQGVALASEILVSGNGLLQLRKLAEVSQELTA